MGKGSGYKRRGGIGSRAHELPKSTTVVLFGNIVNFNFPQMDELQ